MIYAFTGKAGAGKSTAASMIQGAVRLNFKDALLKEIKQNFPTLLAELMIENAGKYKNTAEMLAAKPPVIRALLQNYGTEVRRGDNPNYWVDAWAENYEQNAGSYDITVDDVRFLNEAETVRHYGGVIIRIERPGIEEKMGHSSETEMDQIVPDHTIRASNHQELKTALQKIGLPV